MICEGGMKEADFEKITLRSEVGGMDNPNPKPKPGQAGRQIAKSHSHSVPLPSSSSSSSLSSSSSPKTPTISQQIFRGIGIGVVEGKGEEES
ncbi:predicted protein [Sclerotinia sclerotiorum 1980 UF-70]|uniref:Uncharacterized protein n=1 Tax=Sclerotinia sclerotiorum (strain ATCC 18683 / 1980 / Ss-1) TaxID=665079 RepID=A7ERY5_SCLS1|nr:predicted protein [Sclerotinia sclerotiorum 1980 UF-70]EDN92227.1 predicted protein [Sclerotinia sclerotiorum 1980 UF-70]